MLRSPSRAGARWIRRTRRARSWSSGSPCRSPAATPRTTRRAEPRCAAGQTSSRSSCGWRTRPPGAVDPNTREPTYTAAWASQFPGGKFFGYKVNPNGNVRWGLVNYPPGTIIPGYGPPHDYLTPNADGALGGNPAFSPFLSGPVLPPLPGEAGWKDTIKVFPGFVNRFVVRWAPQAVAVNGVQPGQNLYSFHPTKGPGYVLHCHILDHEDNEMMRPYLPVP